MQNGSFIQHFLKKDNNTQNISNLSCCKMPVGVFIRKTKYSPY